MKINKYIMVLIMLFLSTACDTDVEQLALTSQNNIVAPIMKDCPDILIHAENLKENVVISWNKADFGQPVQIQYLVNLTFEQKTVRIASSFDASITISKEDLNKLLIKELGVPANTKSSVTLYVDAELYNGTASYSSVSSEKKTILVIPYDTVS